MQQHELEDAGGAKELAKYRISVAKEDLHSAIRGLEEKEYRNAESRAYYAIYRAITACFALEFKGFKSHGQTLGAFNKEFIHNGVFPKDLGRRISRAQEMRHECDYSDFYVPSEAEAKESIQTAKEVVQMIEEYLKTKIGGS